MDEPICETCRYNRNGDCSVHGVDVPGDGCTDHAPKGWLWKRVEDELPDRIGWLTVREDNAMGSWYKTFAYGGVPAGYENWAFVTHWCYIQEPTDG